MKKLQEVLQILLSYADASATGDMCSAHDELLMQGPLPEALSPEHRNRLTELRVRYDTREECWRMFL